MLLRVAIHRGKCGASGIRPLCWWRASIVMLGQTRNFDVSTIFCVETPKVVTLMLFGVVDYLGWHFERAKNANFGFWCFRLVILMFRATKSCSYCKTESASRFVGPRNLLAPLSSPNGQDYGPKQPKVPFANSFFWCFTVNALSPEAAVGLKSFVLTNYP